MKISFFAHPLSPLPDAELRAPEANRTGTMDLAIRRVIAAFSLGDDAERHFDLAAQRIQDALLTVSLPEHDALDIGVHAEPARLVGGDYIDIIPLGSRSLFCALGDASGKSLAAALTALMLRYLVRGLVDAIGSSDLARLLRHVNRVVSDDLKDGSFITFIACVYDDALGEFRVANAGHEPPLLLRAESDVVEAIESDGLVLGVDPDGEMTEVSVPMTRGDVVVVYTDGLTEASNERGELFTMERLAAVIRDLRDRPAAEIAEATFTAVRTYAAHELRDDATILVLKAR